MKTSDSITAFSDLGLSHELCEILKELGYEAPTPVQERSIPVLISGKDLIAQAQTGTGKTAAFALPLLNQIDFKKHAPQVLVLAPTRELAIQVAEAFKSYGKRSKSFSVLPIYGGQAISTQLRQLERKPHVIVGTPGRVMDHLRRKTLTLDSLKALVLDEADEMLSMGFLEDIEWIMQQAPASKQTALFSATMPKAIRSIAQKYLRDPEEVVIQQVASESALISQSHWVVSGMHKLDALTRILEVSEVNGVLIFTRTKTETVELAEKLEARGYSAGALNGDMSQDARERMVERFKRGRLDVLVATDVAARGLHVDRISHVINYDIPFDAETYTHRIGRTGRAGRAGTAILFVAPRESGLLKSIERSVGKKIPPFKMPTKEELANKRIDRFLSKIESSLDHADLTSYQKVVDAAVEKTKAPLEKVAAALCALLHTEAPLFVEGPDLASEPLDQGNSRSNGRRREGARRGDKKSPRRDSGRSFSKERKSKKSDGPRGRAKKNRRK